MTVVRIFNFKFAHINAHWVNIRYIWGIYRVRIVYICIVRIFITKHLPAGRYGNFIPVFYNFIFLKISIIVLKVPFTIKKCISTFIFRNVVCTLWHTIFLDTSQIFIKTHKIFLSIYNYFAKNTFNNKTDMLYCL